MERAEVKVQNGMPHILLDGTPVRARLFYSPVPGNGYGNCTIGSEWKEVRVDISSPRTESNGLIHLRFGQAPGRVLFDEFTLTDLSDGKIILRENFDGETVLHPSWAFWYAKKAPPYRAELTVAGQSARFLSALTSAGSHKPPEPIASGNTSWSRSIPNLYPALPVPGMRFNASPSLSCP